MNEQDMNEKIEFFRDHNIKIHVDLDNGTFLNGLILKKLRNNIWIIKEVKLGEVFLFTKDIKAIEQFREKGGKNDL